VSSSSSEYAIEDGSHFGRCLSPSAKIFLPEYVVDVRRGDKEREAMDIGDGSAICISIGESTTVLERLNGVRVSFFGGRAPLLEGDSSDSWLMSVLDG
jgi:hypothetical protein